jgi:hypothetical protein
LLQAVTKRVYLEFEKRGSAEKGQVTGVQGFGEPKAGRAKPIIIILPQLHTLLSIISMPKTDVPTSLSKKPVTP